MNVIPVDNTALAAQMVAQSGRKDVAALSSPPAPSCTDWIVCAAPCRTRTTTAPASSASAGTWKFTPGSDKTSIMMVLNPSPAPLQGAGAALHFGHQRHKLESRPIPDREFEFMFYFDLETSIYSEEFVQLMCELDEM